MQSASPLNANVQTPLPNQLGPYTHTSTPIHNIILPTSAPNLNVNNGQVQGHIPQMSTLNQTLDFSNIGLILHDIQKQLTKLNLLDSVIDRLQHIEQRLITVEQDISHLKRSISDQQKSLDNNS